MITKTYTELIRLPTFKERFDYLALGGLVADRTFGGDRYINQQFYRSKEWRDVCQYIKVRDSANGAVCDLAHPDHPIWGQVMVHHLNPLKLEDIREATEFLLDPEYLVAVSKDTHNALHYGNFGMVGHHHEWKPRQPNDTSPWRL